MHRVYFYYSMSSGSNFSNFWGAFLGAFFAFVFGLIAYRLTKRWERFVLHKNALVKLEKILNRHLNQIAILEHLTSDAIAILSIGNITSNRLFGLKIADSVDIELGSINLINRLFFYQITLDRLEINASTLNHAFTRFEDIQIGGRPLDPVNLEYAKKMLGDFQKDLPLLNQEARGLLLAIRINRKKIKEKESYTFGIFNSSWDFNITKAEIDNENKKFDEEVKSPQNWGID